MEQDLGIPSALFAAPVREIVELGKSQIGFMNMFAIPLFQGVTDVMPAMHYCVDELQRNKSAWEAKIVEEQARARQDSGDSTIKDGMFSPRSMSLAIPSDTTPQKMTNASSSTFPESNDLRRALLTKSPFTPTNGVLNEAEPRHQSMPTISTTPADDVLDRVSPGDVASDPVIYEPSQPTQLQLSFATASVPGLLDHPAQDSSELPNGAQHTNGLVVEHSLVTDTVIVDPPTPIESKRTDSSEKQRSSDGTEASSSAAGDWTDQATSATTSKMPLSPSTKGTSIMSDADLGEKANGNHAGQVLTPTGTTTSTGFFGTGGSSCGSAKQSNGSMTSTEGQARERLESRGREETSLNGHGNGANKGVVVMEKVRNLKKKPSRFRMNFWKRSKSASPQMPVGGSSMRRGLGDDDGRSQ